MQLYLLAILYLVLGAGILLSDTYGLSFALLLSLRYAFRTRKVFRTILILSGFSLTVLLLFFPAEPGPSVLGDFVPLGNIFCLTIWYGYQTLRGLGNTNETEQTVLDATGMYMERNKRNVGFLTILVAVLHFLAPQLVLL